MGTYQEKVTPLEVQYAYSAFMPEGGKPPRAERMQNALPFVTICESCNNLLGREYDPALVDFTRQFRALVKAQAIGIHIPASLTFKLKPNKVIRSLAGHLLAADLDRETYPFAGEARAVIQDPSAPIPASWNVYYWAYLHEKIYVIPNKGITSMSRIKGLEVFFLSTPDDFDELDFCQILKFYPLGFLICTTATLTSPCRLSRHKAQPADYEALFPVPAFAPREAWPEEPHTFGLQMMGNAVAKGAVARRRYVMKGRP